MVANRRGVGGASSRRGRAGESLSYLIILWRFLPEFPESQVFFLENRAAFQPRNLDALEKARPHRGRSLDDAKGPIFKGNRGDGVVFDLDPLMPDDVGVGDTSEAAP